MCNIIMYWVGELAMWPRHAVRKQQTSVYYDVLWVDHGAYTVRPRTKLNSECNQNSIRSEIRNTHRLSFECGILCGFPVYKTTYFLSIVSATLIHLSLWTYLFPCKGFFRVVVNINIKTIHKHEIHYNAEKGRHDTATLATLLRKSVLPDSPQNNVLCAQTLSQQQQQQPQ